MAFVKLDTGILDSTLWIQRDPREVFITALLMALPREIREPTPTFKVRSLERTDFVVPPGWYGFIGASGPGIVRRAGLAPDSGLDALAELGEPDPESRSSDWEGRRLVRVDGGFIVLNFMKYRDKDDTAAERAKRYRDRKKELRDTGVTRDERGVTPFASPAEAEAEAEANKPPTPKGSEPLAGFAEFWSIWPKSSRKGGKADCEKAWRSRRLESVKTEILAHVRLMAQSNDWTKQGGEFIPAPVVYLRGAKWDGADVGSPQQQGLQLPGAV